MTILRTTRFHEGQELEIFVKYDPKTNTAEEIQSVNLKSHGRTIPIGNFVHGIDELLSAINKIIDNTDWREIYREREGDQEIDDYLDSVPVTTERKAISVDALNHHMQKAFMPFIKY